MTSSQPRIVSMTSSPREDSRCPRRSPQYNSSLGLNSGVMQVVCGVCTPLLGGVFFASVLDVIDAGAGVWCGVFIFIPTGVLGIFSEGKRTGVIIAYLVMCLISCLASLVMAAFIFYWYWGVYCSSQSEKCSHVTAYQAQIQVVIGILMVFEFVGAAIGAHGCRQVVPSIPTTRRSDAVHYESRQPPANINQPPANINVRIGKGAESNRRY